jgi:hypothetical protein
MPRPAKIKKLDRARSYAEIHGFHDDEHEARFKQDGILFDHKGDEIKKDEE